MAPISTSSKPQPLMSVDTTGVQEECKSRRQREREVWRASCRGGHSQGTVRREMETSTYSSSYTEVMAVGGRDHGGNGAGEGRHSLEWRGGDEVSVL